MRIYVMMEYSIALFIHSDFNHGSLYKNILFHFCLFHFILTNQITSLSRHLPLYPVSSSLIRMHQLLFVSSVYSKRNQDQHTRNLFLEDNVCSILLQ